jgi:glycosyltransferase involved in cell wall biosynthesis
MTVSVIVPVYNNEYYLNRCLKSIINQTYKDLDIIVIDDGSTDKSPEICDRFAKKDCRIRVVHKENEGVSVARNVGIEKATGEWLCFVDSDDILPLNSIELLVSGIEDGIDFVCGAAKEFSFKTIRSHIKDDVYSKESINSYVDFLNSLYTGPIAKLFRSDVIKADNIFFPVGIKYSEDTIFWLSYVGKTNKIRAIDIPVYYINALNQTSASKKKYPLKDFSCWIYTNMRLRTLICGEEKAEKVKSVESNQLMFFSWYESLIRKFILQEESDKSVLDYINSNFSSLIVNESISDIISGNRKLCEFYESYYKNYDLDKYSTVLCNYETSDRSSSKRLRKIIYSCKQFIVFRLGIGYKNTYG